MHLTQNRLLAIVVAAAGFADPALCLAQATTTWTGAADGLETGRWEASSNWTDGPPATDGTTSVVLAGTTNTDTSFTTSQAVAGLVYDAAAGAFRIASDESLTVGAGGVASHNAQTHVLAAPIILAADQTWNTGAGAIELQRNLSGTNAIIKSGMGTLRFASASDSSGYTGTIRVAEGTVEVSGPQSFGAAAAISLEGGTVKAIAGNDVSNPYLAPFRIAATGSAIDTNGYDMAIRNLAAASNNLPLGTTFHKKGAGRLTVTGSLDLTGPTLFAIEEGSVALTGGMSTNVSAAFRRPSLYVAPGASFDLGGNSATFFRLSGGGDITGFNTLHVASNLTENVEMAYSGKLSGNRLNVQLQPGNVLKLTGDNSGLTGDIVFFSSQGALAIASDTALGAPNASIDMLLGGTLRFDQSMTLNPQRQIHLAVPFSSVPFFDTNGNDVVISQSFSTAGRLGKQGAGKLTLTGNNEGKVTQIALNEGTLEIAGPQNIGSPSILGRWDAALSITGGSSTLASPITVGSLGGETSGTTIHVAQASTNVTLTGTLGNITNIQSVGGRLIKDGPGTLTLAGTSNHSLGNLIKAGTLAGTTNTLKTMLNVEQAGTVHFDQATGGAVNATIKGQGTVILDGTGTWQLATDTTAFSGVMQLVGTSTLQVNSALGAAGGVLELDNHTTLQANNSVNLAVLGPATSTKIIAGGDVSLGDAASFAGFNTAGSLAVESHAVTLRSAGLAGLGSLTTLNGGTLAAARGVALGSGEVIQGAGRVNGRVAADLGSTIAATGNLRLGDAASPAGYRSAGDLEIGAHVVTLDDANEAVLGTLTTLDGGALQARASAAATDASPHFLLNPGDNITGRGTIKGNFKNNGNVIGAGFSEDQRLVFDAPWTVSGKGTFANTLVLGTFAPGESPGVVDGQNMAFAGVVEIELGGAAPGNGPGYHDQVNDAQVLSLFGGASLALKSYDGYLPTLGQQFEIITAAGGINGALGELFVDPWFTTNGIGFTLETTSRSIVATVAAATADFTRDGLIDGADVLAWQRSAGARGAGVAADGNFDGVVDGLDLDLWRGAVPTAGVGAAAAPVPEPSVAVLAAAACLAAAAGGRRGQSRRVEPRGFRRGR